MDVDCPSVSPCGKPKWGGGGERTSLPPCKILREGTKQQIPPQAPTPYATSLILIGSGGTKRKTWVEVSSKAACRWSHFASSLDDGLNDKENVTGLENNA